MPEVPFTLLNVSKYLGEVRIFLIHDWVSFVTFKDTIILFFTIFSLKVWAWSLFPASGSAILENCGFKWLFRRKKLELDDANKFFSGNSSWINLVYTPVKFYESTINWLFYIGCHQLFNTFPSKTCALHKILLVHVVLDW